MKATIILAPWLLILMVVCLLSCNKESFNYPPDTVGQSKVIHFPVIQLKGDKVVVIVEGSSYTEDSAIVTLSDTPFNYTITTDLDVNTPGVYLVNYTATNPQGFSSQDYREVVVVSTAMASDPTVAANDFSGSYYRAATGDSSVWTKIGYGVYWVANPGGAVGFENAYVVLLNPSGNSITVPSQYAPDYDGTVSTESETYIPAVPPDPAGFSWVFNAPGFGTGIRIFVKQ